MPEIKIREFKAGERISPAMGVTVIAYPQGLAIPLYLIKADVLVPPIASPQNTRFAEVLKENEDD